MRSLTYGASERRGQRDDRRGAVVRGEAVEPERSDSKEREQTRKLEPALHCNREGPHLMNEYVVEVGARQVLDLLCTGRDAEQQHKDNEHDS